MNARGILPAAQQVLAMLICLLIWGVPHPAMDGGYPHPVLTGGTTIQSQWGVPHPVLDGEYPGVHPSWSRMDILPISRMGYPPSGPGMGVPPISRMGSPRLNLGTCILILFYLVTALKQICAEDFKMCWRSILSDSFVLGFLSTTPLSTVPEC